MLSKLRRAARQINIIELLDSVIVETEQQLFDLVRSQLASGRSATGSLPRLKSDRYSKRKQSMGSKAPFGVTDLILTRSFINKFKIRFSTNSFIVRSRDQKNSLILKKYGPEIFNLSEENLSIYVNKIILPLMIKKIKNVLLKQYYKKND